MHSDGDELLYLVSGRVHVILEEADGQRVVEVTGGPALVAPWGVWHQILLQEPTQLLHINPGPRSGCRPLDQS